MSTNTKLAQAAGQEPYTREQHFALREAHCIAAGDAYFEVRPHLDAYVQRRSAFDDGFARGFDKGTELAEARAALASQPAAGVALTREQIRSIESPPDPDTVDRAIWTDVRMELEAAGRDDLSQFVWIATKSNGRA